MKRVAPSERLREELAQVLAQGTVEDPIEFIAWAGARLMLQEVLEQEVDAFRESFPSVVALVAGQEERFLAYLHFPKEHHSRIRSTNALERCFREVRRRTKVMGSRFPGENSCLSLVWAVIHAASRKWRGLPMLPAAVKQIEHLRRGQLAAPNPPIPTDSQQKIGQVA